MENDMLSSIGGLPQRLVTDQLMSEEDVQAALLNAKKAGISLVSYLVKQKKIEPITLAMINAELLGMPVFDLNAFNLSLIPRDVIPPKMIRQHHAIPLFQRNKRLFIGISDLTNKKVIDDFRFHSRLTVDAVLVEDNKLTHLIDHWQDDNQEHLEALSEELKSEEADSQNIGTLDLDADTEDGPVVRFVNKMLSSAIKLGASDLHFEPYEKMYRVRFRIDGVLQEYARPPVSLSARIASRLKIMSSMDISERRKPQDGRVKLRLSDKSDIDFRVNTLPTIWGEKIVLRILDVSSAQLGIDALGYSEIQKDLYLQALSQPQGMILVTGPTGSGKTVSLYTGLYLLNGVERNISTVEDPVEINLEGVNQVNVNGKQGLNFAEALRAFLRQDPDVIMVGEIRDLDTANVAVKAAQTGHLVLSTLHTNSAAETLTRLLNMGVPAFNVATSVSLIIAQRLARRLCPDCKREQNVPEKTLLAEGVEPSKIKTFMAYGPNPDGCEHCTKGYKGRIGVFEVMSVSPALQQIIMESGNSLDMIEIAKREGFITLKQSGIAKIAAGVTSLEEVNRVTQN